VADARHSQCASSASIIDRVSAAGPAVCAISGGCGTRHNRSCGQNWKRAPTATDKTVTLPCSPQEKNAMLPQHRCSVLLGWCPRGRSARAQSGLGSHRLPPHGARPTTTTTARAAAATTQHTHTQHNKQGNTHSSQLQQQSHSEPHLISTSKPPCHRHHSPLLQVKLKQEPCSISTVRNH
jgi:hypothetical protein